MAQSGYRGWAMFGIVIFVAIGANVLLAVMLQRRGRSYRATLPAGLILVATLAVFEWTYPANQATANWTTAPADWESMHMQWELLHAANAVLTFIALCWATLSAVAKRD